MIIIIHTYQSSLKIKHHSMTSRYTVFLGIKVHWVKKKNCICISPFSRGLNHLYRSYQHHFKVPGPGSGHMCTVRYNGVNRRKQQCVE